MLSLEKCQSQASSALNKLHPTCRLVKQPTKYPLKGEGVCSLGSERKSSFSPYKGRGTAKIINVLFAKAAFLSSLRAW